MYTDLQRWTNSPFLGESIGVDVYAEPGNKNAVEIARNAMAHAKSKGYNAVIVDTAGRLAIDEAMMAEIQAVRDAVQPHETLFTVDAMTGQDAVRTAKAFNDVLDFTGVVLTKLDGDTRGVLRWPYTPSWASPSNLWVSAKRWTP